MPHRPVSRRRVLGGLLGIAALGPVVAACSEPSPSAQPPAGTPATSSASSSSTPSTSSGAAGSTSTTGSTRDRVALTEAVEVATGFDVPWSAVVLPDGTVLVSERDSAAIKAFTLGGAVRTLGTVPGVVPNGEAGLLGLAVDPATSSKTTVLFAYLTASDGNRIVSIPLTGDGLGTPTVLVQGIPKAGNHNGGRLAFGPDGYLYASTGDAGTTSRSQDRTSLGGKILRMTTTGEPAPGNPFGSLVWSLGHRNVQGLAWSADGQMWASEFGQNTWDELNVIVAGQNYGWPTVEGRAGRSGFVDPVQQWSTDDASPSGICIGPDGAVLMAALKGESLWKVPVNADGSTGEPRRLLQGTYGRLRDVVVGPDGNVWVVTNNTARGTPRDGDDRIVRLPESLTG